MAMPIYIPIVTVDVAMGRAFIEAVCGHASSGLVMDDADVRLDVVHCLAGVEDALEHAFASGDAAAILVRHLDALAVEHLRAAYRLLPGEPVLPAVTLILREPGKAEFKMSCPACSQKLWVRDEDEGRAGRCPHCKETFVLPAQAAHLRTSLLLAESAPLVTLTQGNTGACRGTIADLVARVRHRARARKSATMRVQLTDDDQPPAAPP